MYEHAAPLEHGDLRAGDHGPAVGTAGLDARGDVLEHAAELGMARFAQLDARILLGRRVSPVEKPLGATARRFWHKGTRRRNDSRGGCLVVGWSRLGLPNATRVAGIRIGEMKDRTSIVVGGMAVIMLASATSALANSHSVFTVQVGPPILMIQDREMSSALLTRVLSRRLPHARVEAVDFAHPGVDSWHVFVRPGRPGLTRLMLSSPASEPVLVEEIPTTGRSPEALARIIALHVVEALERVRAQEAPMISAPSPEPEVVLPAQQVTTFSPSTSDEREWNLGVGTGAALFFPPGKAAFALELDAAREIGTVLVQFDLGVTLPIHQNRWGVRLDSTSVDAALRVGAILPWEFLRVGLAVGPLARVVFAEARGPDTSLRGSPFVNFALSGQAAIDLVSGPLWFGVEIEGERYFNWQEYRVDGNEIAGLGHSTIRTLVRAGVSL